MNLDNVFQDINLCHTKLLLQLSHEENIRNIRIDNKKTIEKFNNIEFTNRASLLIKDLGTI